MSETTEDNTLPVLPLKNAAPFPGQIVPLVVGRHASVAAVEAALASEEKTIALFAQTNTAAEKPTTDELYRVGTRAVIKHMVRSEKGIELLAMSMERVALKQMVKTEPYFKAKIETLQDPTDDGLEFEAMHRAVLDQLDRLHELSEGPAGAMLGEVVAHHHDPQCT